MRARSLTALLALMAFTGPSHAAEAPLLLQRRLPVARTGDVLDIADLLPTPPNLSRHSVSRTWTGGTMVFSGSPEYVPGPGVLYADTLEPGAARLLLYHVNDSVAAGKAQSLKIAVVVEPADPQRPATVTVRRRIVHGPSTSYSHVGVQSALDLLRVSETPQTTNLAGPALLDASLEQRVIPAYAYPALVQAQYEFDIADAPVRLTVAALASGVNTLATYRTLPILPRPTSGSGYVHDRGTYPGQMDKHIESTSVYDTSSGLAHLGIASGLNYSADPDAFAGQGSPGYDALLSVPSVLLGNYGVVYTVRLRLKNTDGRRVAVLLNPRGGIFAGAVSNSEAMTGGGVFTTPSSGILPPTTKATVLGRWDPRRTPEITIRWTPPGASYLPVEWVLVPYPEPGDVDGSGAVDLSDAVLALRFSARLATPNARQRIAGDIAPAGAPDGAITSADAAAILRLGGM